MVTRPIRAGTWAAIVVLSAIVPLVSYAGITYTLPASVGQPVNSTANCFYESTGRETNQCSTAQYWSFPLKLDYSYVGNFVGVNVQVFAPSSQAAVSCYDYGLGWYGAEQTEFLYTSNTVTSTNLSTVETLSPGPVYMFDYMQVICVVKPNGVINTINTYYNPNP